MECAGSVGGGQSGGGSTIRRKISCIYIHVRMTTRSNNRFWRIFREDGVMQDAPALVKTSKRWHRLWCLHNTILRILSGTWYPRVDIFILWLHIAMIRTHHSRTTGEARGNPLPRFWRIIQKGDGDSSRAVPYPLYNKRISLGQIDGQHATLVKLLSLQLEKPEPRVYLRLHPPTPQIREGLRRINKYKPRVSLLYADIHSIRRAK